MGKAKGWRNVMLREAVYEKAMSIYNEYKKNKPFTAFTDFLNNFLWEVMESNEYLYRYAPSLQFIGTHGDTIDIADHFINRIVEVQVVPEGKFLYCRHCDRDDCLHVGFCFAIREVNKILVEKGFKQPRVKEQ